MVQAETGSSPLLVTGSGSTRADIKKNIKLLADILKPLLKPCFNNIPHQTLSTDEMSFKPPELGNIWCLSTCVLHQLTSKPNQKRFS